MDWKVMGLLQYPVIVFYVTFLIAACIGVSGCVTEESARASDLIFLTEDFPPFNYEEEGRLKGIGVELLDAVYDEEGFSHPDERMRIGLFTDGYQMALTNPGYALFSVARTPEREDLFLWAGPIASYDIVLFSRRGSDILIDSQSDLNQYRIGAVKDDVSVLELMRAGVDDTRIITDPDPISLIHMLDAGEIDLFASGDLAGEYLIAKATGKYGYFKQVYRLKTVDLYYAFNKETPQKEVEWFQSALNALKKAPARDGLSRYDQILNRYIPSRGLSTLTYMTEEYYPYNFKEDDSVQGISVDILEEVFLDLNCDLSRKQVILSTWENGYQKTLSTPGYVLFSTARTPEREENFLWAGPIVRSRNVLFMRSGAIMPAELNLTSLSIGAITDDVAVYDLAGLGVETITYATDAGELIRMLEEGEIDAWAYAEYPGMRLIDQYARNPAVIEIAYPLSTHEYYLAFNKETPPQLVQACQQALDRIRSEKDVYGVSRYERILYRYLTPGYADGILTEADAIDLVSLTADALARDAPSTIRAINAGIHPYRDEEKSGLYVFAYDTDVVMAAHATNIHLVGVSFKGKTDVTGKAFRDEMVAGALKNGSGWEDYIYINPAESGLFWKSTYYQLVTGSDGNEYVVCSGIFKTG
ncbi:transporter substrate-binding domain-containing protein [Methanocalculus taiwanensis]|uniref:Transporter substrate-binding domain-containing protein n=1 Tax=Methanocalculus taiwanensis TaxID=106207 RepID=A0ABD4TLR2_9EURY|nr:transporter substrate-binding domain-containing protein [Methanocalculus taiwanensis]MCQ1538522.1 transporter substrate-binding domain-containing protein [Methanocalculus taiwanensis]